LIPGTITSLSGRLRHAAITKRQRPTICHVPIANFVVAPPCSCKGGESGDSTGPIFIPVAGGQHAVVLDGALASRRRRQLVERRHGFKIRTLDERATRTDGRPIIHLCGPAPTPPLIRPVERISGCSPIGPWLLLRPRGKTRPQPRVSPVRNVDARAV